AAAAAGPAGAAKPAPAAKPAARPAAPAHPEVQRLPANRTIALLGQDVTGPDGKVIGRLVDVLVNAAGVPEAAVIDFGGFMGVGSRKIAVRWNTLRFHPGASRNRVAITLLPAEISAAPQFKGTQRPAPVVVAHPRGRTTEAQAKPAAPQGAPTAGSAGPPKPATATPSPKPTDPHR
ncbi:MAG: PRC-barrel domain-containing protein, partial [Rhodospirillales bacterium]|nr:PRC-barrel domain-containing protein [Rhodospirillales bacterium]